MKRITAAEARTLAESIDNGRYNIELDKVFSLIHQEAKNGDVRMILQITREYQSEIFEELKKQGYKLVVYDLQECGSPYFETVDVSW